MARVVGSVERANQEAEEEPIRGAREGGGGRGSEATPLHTSPGSRCSAWPEYMAPLGPVGWSARNRVRDSLTRCQERAPRSPRGKAGATRAAGAHPGFLEVRLSQHQLTENSSSVT